MDVVLRDVAAGDLEIFFEHQIDPVAVEMVGFASRNRNDFESHWNKILADRDVAKKTILFDGQVVGYLVCFERAGKLEVGYWIGREYWGKGITSEALPRFLRHETRRPLHAVVAKHNAASIRVLEKSGFTRAGQDGKEITLTLGAPR